MVPWKGRTRRQGLGDCFWHFLERMAGVGGSQWAAADQTCLPAWLIQPEPRCDVVAPLQGIISGLISNAKGRCAGSSSVYISGYLCCSSRINQAVSLC